MVDSNFAFCITGRVFVSMDASEHIQIQNKTSLEEIVVEGEYIWAR